MVKPIRPIFTLSDVRPLSPDNRLDSVKQRRAKALPNEKYDMDLLGECVRSYNNKEDFRRERARVLRYLFGNQWGDVVNVKGFGDMTEEKLIKMQGSIPLKNNVMVSLWLSVYGIHAKQETEPVCYARAEQFREISDNLSAALQTNWQNNYVPDVFDHAYAESLASGAAFVKETFEERNQVYDSYTDYVNPYFMFWEGGSDPSHRDIRLIGCLLDMSREDIYYRFAKPEYGLTIAQLNKIFHIGEYSGVNSGTAQQLNDVNSVENVSFYRSTNSNLYRVIEVWREEVKPRYQCYDPIETNVQNKYFRCEKEDLKYIIAINKERKTLYEERGVPPEERGYITAHEIVDKYWQYYFMAPDGRILCEGESPYDHKEHPFTVMLYPYINGEVHPFMSFSIDQQRYINRTVTMGDMALKNAAKGMTFLPLSMKPDGMTTEEYANQKSKYDAVFVYDDTKPAALKSERKPEFYTHSAFNIGTTEMLQLQMNMIHEVTGVTGALQGKAPASGTAASRYYMEAQNATTTIYPLLKKANSFEERAALKKCITIQQYYEEGRDITPRKSEERVFYRANAARNVKASVSIKNSASSPAFLERGNEMLDKLLTMGLDMRTYLKHYDAPGVDKILQDVDAYMNQVQQGQQPTAPVQVHGANQQQANMAQQLMQGNGQLFTRQQPGQRLVQSNNFAA